METHRAGLQLQARHLSPLRTEFQLRGFRLERSGMEATDSRHLYVNGH